MKFNSWAVGISKEYQANQQFIQLYWYTRIDYAGCSANGRQSVEFLRRLEILYSA